MPVFMLKRSNAGSRQVWYDISLEFRSYSSKVRWIDSMRMRSFKMFESFSFVPLMAFIAGVVFYGVMPVPEKTIGDLSSSGNTPGTKESRAIFFIT